MYLNGGFVMVWFTMVFSSSYRLNGDKLHQLVKKKSKKPKFFLSVILAKYLAEY